MLFSFGEAACTCHPIGFPQDQANQGDLKLAEPKADNFPREWWNFSKQTPLVQVFLNEKCP